MTPHEHEHGEATLGAVALDTARLTEREMRILIGTHESMATAEFLTPGLRRWHLELAQALRHVLSVRTLTWLDLAEHMSATMRIPPDWQTCVDLLPEETRGEGPPRG